MDSLRETILRMLPSGDTCLRLIDTYEIDAEDLNSDDDGDIEEPNEEDGESEMEEDQIPEDEQPEAKKKPRVFDFVGGTPGEDDEPDDCEQFGGNEADDQFNIFDRIKSKDTNDGLDEETITAPLSRAPKKDMVSHLEKYERDDPKSMTEDEQ